MNPNSRPKVTILYLLYHAERTVPELVQALTNQRHPQHSQQSNWLEAIFIDDCSQDSTRRVLTHELSKLGNPPHYSTVFHTQNQGLAHSLNHGFKLARADFVLTCHCDVLFESDDYVAALLNLMEKTPQAASITGHPNLPKKRTLSFFEKVNTVANLMDILPRDPQSSSLIPIGFAEGRCDLFRASAMSQIGYYGSELRTSGEDQILAARLRSHGFEIYQAPHLSYSLSVSEEQNTLFRLARHVYLFGSTHPYILFKIKGTHHGILGTHAGSNRKLRTLLRLFQLIFFFAYLVCLILLLFKQFIPILFLLGSVFVCKLFIFRKHLKLVHMSGLELFWFYAYQPVLDFSYSMGFFQGLLIILRRPAPS